MRRETNVEVKAPFRAGFELRPSCSHLALSEETEPCRVRVCPRRLKERTEDENCEPGQIKPTDELQRKQSLLKTGADAQKTLKTTNVKEKVLLVSSKFPFPLTGNRDGNRGAPSFTS